MSTLLHRRYEVQYELMAATLNTVLFARDRYTGERCVIKAAKRGMCADGRHSELCANLMAEGRTLLALAAANIAGPLAIDFFHINYCSYLVLRRLPGVDLQTLFEQEQLFTSDILDAIIQVCDTLNTVHQLGYVHGDVKPANIIRCPNGRALLIDWGSALLLNQSRPALPYSLTVEYASPEQIEGYVGATNDIYALGRTLEALVPYASQRVQHIIGTATAPLDERYRHIGQMSTALQRLQIFDRLTRSFGATVLLS
jgi:serine/threonine protein kinase